MIPETIPVMTLPGTVFFPRTLLPLHIFEPRYRLMLEETLGSHRIMAVALLDDSDPAEAPDAETPHRVATAGVIRACQTNHDGTSNLILEGLTRIEIVAVVQDLPFRLNQIRPISDPPAALEGETVKHCRQLLEILRAPSQTGSTIPGKLADTLEAIRDPSAFCDLLVFSLAASVRFKQRMLEMIDPGERLRQTLIHFRAEQERYRLGEFLQGNLGDDEIGRN